MKNAAQKPKSSFNLKTIGTVTGILVALTLILTYLGIGPFSHSSNQPVQFIATSGNNSPAFYSSGNISGNINAGNGTQINGNLTFVLVNIGSTASPKVEGGKYDFFNQKQKDGTYLTAGRLKIISQYPVGSLYISVTGETIKTFWVQKVEGGGLMGSEGNDGKGNYYNRIPNAYGEYAFIISSTQPEEFKIGYKIE